MMKQQDVLSIALIEGSDLRRHVRSVPVAIVEQLLFAHTARLIDDAPRQSDRQSAMFPILMLVVTVGLRKHFRNRNLLSAAEIGESGYFSPIVSPRW